MSIIRISPTSKRKRRTHPKESEIQKAVLQYLRTLQIACWRINTTGIPNTNGGMRTNPEMRGVADIHAIVKMNGLGVACWLEIKTPKGRLTEHQKSFGHKVRKAGGIYKVIRSVGEVESWLKTITELGSEVGWIDQTIKS